MTSPAPTPRRTPGPDRPHPGPGVCGWCGKPLTDRRRRWCAPPPGEQSPCLIAYLASIGPGFREAVRLANIRTYRMLTCEGCLTVIEAGWDWEADHRVPLALGGTNDPARNGRALCPGCHRDKTRQDARDIAAARRPDGPTGRARKREEGHRRTKPLDAYEGGP